MSRERQALTTVVLAIPRERLADMLYSVLTEDIRLDARSMRSLGIRLDRAAWERERNDPAA